MSLSQCYRTSAVGQTSVRTLRRAAPPELSALGAGRIHSYAVDLQTSTTSWAIWIHCGSRSSRARWVRLSNELLFLETFCIRVVMGVAHLCVPRPGHVVTVAAPNVKRGLNAMS